MDTERLIEEIRKFPVLYDQSNRKYRNADYKKRVWKIVSTNVRAKGGVEECKKRWTSVRDQLRRTLQKRKTKSGQAAENYRRYKYESILKFLLPYLSEKEGLTNVPSEGNEWNDDSESSADSQETQQEAFTHETIKEENVSNVDEYDEEESGTTTSSTTYKVSAEKFKFAPPSAKIRKIPGREVKKPQDSSESQLMAYILAEREAEKANKQSSQTSKQDPVDAFLCGLAPTLKSLNPILLNETRGKIFAIVQEVEMKQLQMNSSGHGT